MLIIAAVNVQAQVVTVLTDSDPASLGMAGASVASQATAFSLDNNPAAMSMYEGKMAAGASYFSFQPAAVKSDIISALGFYKLTERLSAGLLFKSLSYEPYDVTSAEGRSTSTYSPGELELGLGASYLIIDGLSVGVNAKYANLRLYENTSVTAFMFDLAARYTNGPLAAGINARNLGSDYFNLKVGAAYTISAFTASAQAEYLANVGLMGSLGAQYSYKDMLFARVGFHLGKEDRIPSFLSLGAGVKFAGFVLDLSYLTLSKTLGNSLLLGLSYAF